MNDCMTFPDTVEEFMEQYKVVDTDGIYMSKGAELVPIFRMRQWFEHLSSARPDVPDTNVGDMINRQALMKEFSDFVRRSNNSDLAPTPTWNDAVSLVGSMPSAQRKGRWKDYPIADGCIQCSVCGVLRMGEPSNFCPNCGAKMDDDDIPMEYFENGGI